MRKIILILLMFLKVSSYSQNSNNPICECCSYYFHWKNDLEKTFNPIIIMKNNIKELTIYTTSKQNILPKNKDFKVIDTEYKEMVLKFNENGFVESQILFNRKGKFH